MKFMHICWTNWHVEIHVHFCFGATSFIYSPHWYNNAHFSVFISTKILTVRLFISTIKRGNVLFGRFQNSYGAVWVCKTNLWHQNWRFFDDWFDSSTFFVFVHFNHGISCHNITMGIIMIQGETSKIAYHDPRGKEKSILKQTWNGNEM